MPFTRGKATGPPKRRAQYTRGSGRELASRRLGLEGGCGGCRATRRSAAPGRAADQRLRRIARALSIPQILAWADAHFTRTRRWHDERTDRGRIGRTWMAVQLALFNGLRGLPGGSSLARLLARERGVPNEKDLPPFQIPEILQWADAHHARHDKWPTSSSGVISEAPHETWLKVHTAAPFRSSRTARRVVAGPPAPAHRGVRNVMDLAPLSEKQILAWADAFYSRTGRRRPTVRAGPIKEAPGENWRAGAVEYALVKGRRGRTRRIIARPATRREGGIMAALNSANPTHDITKIRAWYGSSIPDFVDSDSDNVLGSLARNSDFPVLPQRDAWSQIRLLQSQLTDLHRFAVHGVRASRRGPAHRRRTPDQPHCLRR